MSLEASIAAWSADLPPAEKLVLLCLADHADGDGRCWPSLDRVASRCGVHRGTVIRSLRALADAGHITVEHAQGRINRYVVHPVVQVDTSCTVQPVTLCNPSQDATRSAVQPVAQGDGSSCMVQRDPLHGATRISQESPIHRPERAHARETGRTVQPVAENNPSRSATSRPALPVARSGQSPEPTNRRARPEALHEILARTGRVPAVRR